MASFVRGSLVTCAVTFTPTSGTAQPSDAYVVLAYTNTSGAEVETTLTLARDTETNIWTASWDSTLAAAGAVDWWAYSSGGVQAAAQGSFTVKTNRASDP